MSLPYFLGCPSWSEPAWRGSLFAKGLSSQAFLPAYSQVFNCVEGNTTFYAKPSAETVSRWAAQVPDDFHFCAKFYRQVSHSNDLREQIGAALEFIELLKPLLAKGAPMWLQLPASFGPWRLPELETFVKAMAVPMAVEVRHLAFFMKGEEERALNRLLLEQGVERICLDSRALFSCQEQSAAVLHAQAKKPRLPLRPAAFSQSPQVRFIGHPELAANDEFLAPWVEKVAQWIEAGLTPHVFLHTPDNHQAPELALRFHAQLCTRLPGLAAREFTATQLGLF